MAPVTTPVHGVAALGPEWDAAFDAGPGLQSRRAWFEATEEAALPADATALYLTARDAAGRPLAVLPTLHRPGRAPGSLTTPYTVLFQPLLLPGADPRAAGHVLGRQLRRWPTTTLEALDPAWPGLVPFTRGLAAAGLATARFEHFGNWHESVAGLDWPTYLEARPGPLRGTIRRRTRAAARDGTITCEIIRTPEGLDAGLAAYEDVYARSWKVPEPYPRFNAALLRRAAAMGALRLGVMRRAGQPLAAQYWTVADGTATVLKLAHDDAEKALSPGTVLTAHMVQALLHEGVAMLDFGRGDDPYKRGWAGHRRPRIGLLIAAPWRPRGLVALARHHAGTLRRRLRGPGDNGGAAAHIAATPDGEPAP